MSERKFKIGDYVECYRKDSFGKDERVVGFVVKYQFSEYLKKDMLFISKKLGGKSYAMVPEDTANLTKENTSTE